MAHRNNERPLTQPPYPVGTVLSNNRATTTLRDFAKSAVVLRDILYDDSPLKETEYVFMEKHMQVLQMAYLRWKRKHVWPTDFH